MGTNVIAAADRRLNSWKEIGSFFSRDERTVKRWEAARGLPVHRIPGRSGAKVFGYAGELTAWLKSGSTARPAGMTRTQGAMTAKVRSSAARVVQPQARELYLAGMYYGNLLTPEALDRALHHFTQAIAIDPDYAESYVGLAHCYTQFRRFTLMPDDEAYASARTAAERAVALDEKLPEAHSLLGVVTFYGAWDVPAALAAFRRALELGPGSSQAHHRYAMALLHMGRFDEALVEIASAQALNPVYRPVLADKGRILFHAGRQDEAVALLTQLAIVAPDFLSPHAYLAAIRLALGDHAQYLAAALRAAELRGDLRREAIVRAGQQGFDDGGARAMACAMLAEQKRQHARGESTFYDLAQAHAIAGDGPAALDHLGLAFERHESPVLNLLIDPAFMSLHRDPGLRRLAERLGFEPR